MNFFRWLVVLLLLTSPPVQAQHQACRGRTFIPCVCLGSGNPCKCTFAAIWLTETGEICGGSAGSDKSEAGVRAHAEQRVATMGRLNSCYRRYEIACTQCAK